MKRLLLGLSIIVTAFALIACGKDKKDNNPYPYYNSGNYGQTPNDPNNPYGYGYGGYGYGNCGMPTPMPMQPGMQPGMMPMPYPGMQPYPMGPMGNCYNQYTAGSCNPSYAGRGQLCPVGFVCQPMGYNTGICTRGYY